MSYVKQEEEFLAQEVERKQYFDEEFMLKQYEKHGHHVYEKPQPDFVPLTGSIITYIVDLINHSLTNDRNYKKYDIILNVYKAFECFVEEDALWDYKKNIQHFIANYLFGEVLEQLNVIGCQSNKFVWYNSTDREVMYFYDVLFCNPQFVLNSKDDPSRRFNIGSELFDCHYYLSRLQPEHVESNQSFITIHDIPAIRLLEEALYNKSTECITCLVKSGWLYNKYMPLYIYLKHNHKVWGANNPRSLVDSDMLFEMMLNANVVDESFKDLLLEIAIGGLMIKHTNRDNMFHNVVNPNLALVKKLVPKYFPREKYMTCIIGPADVYEMSLSAVNSTDIYEMSLFAMKPNEFSLNYYVNYRTPYNLWEEYRNRQVYAPLFSDGTYEVSKIPRNEEIGEYLRC